MMSNRIEFENRESAFRDRLQTFAITNIDHIDTVSFLDDAFSIFNTQLSAIISGQYILKVGACFIAMYKKNGDELKVYIYCEHSPIDIDTNLSRWYTKNIIEKVKTRMEEFQTRGSGWQFDSIVELEVTSNQYDVHRGAIYMELCDFLKNKKAIVNVQNNDEYCFKWAVLSALYPAQKNASRVVKYCGCEDLVDFSGIEFPVKLEHINRFEKVNPSISINVYMFDECKESVYPVRLTKCVKQSHIHLMLLSNVIGETVAGEITRKSHYCWIKNLSRLLSSQISKGKMKLYFCDRCLQHFTTSQRLSDHILNCMVQNDCKIEMPQKAENIISFKNYFKKLAVPFIVYADVESLLKIPTKQFCKSNSTKAYQQHETYSVGYYLKCNFNPSKSHYKSHRGPDCIRWFVNELHQIALEVASILRYIAPLNMTQQNEEEFQNSEHCHICEDKFDFDDVKVRDHCHLTGKYRGAAHSNCNLTYKVGKFVPVIFHNLSNYDCHFIIREISAQFPGDISIIPVNDQNYISFTKTVDDARVVFGKNGWKNTIKLKFIDSFRFMASSLEKLAQYLPSEKKTILKSQFRYLSDNKLMLLEQKGVFPYDFVDSWEKLNHPHLPSREEFYSRLSESEISTHEYEFAQKVWKEYNIQTLGEYSDLYMKTDILLLADVFENFRETSLQIYKLDPAQYFTSPGFSWDAMLKHTKVQIELFTDIDMLLFIERGIRGGISQCSERHFKANNKYMEDFNPSKPSSYLMYLDVNNLYGDSMMKALPLNGFEWCDDDIEKIKNTADDASTGYILEVDLEYPIKLHDSHSDYPLCAETRAPPGSKHSKLLLTLYNKNNYVIHYTMLKFVLRQGLVLKKIHRIIKFHQQKWLEPYIQLNTYHRTHATNEFEKNLYKLMTNAVYGKTMENLRTRVDIKLKSCWSGRYGAAELIAKPNFVRRKIFDENLIAIEMSKTTIKMTKPIVIGMSVLDISKIVMCDYHYNYMKLRYGDNAKIMYTDTDSFVYKIFCEDFYEDMKADVHQKYDTSDFQNDRINMPKVNKKVPGLMKDENNGKCMTEFVGLRSKMYCVRVNHQDTIKKAKGVKKYVLKKKICFDDYLKCIQDNCVINTSQNSIRSNNHIVYSIEQNKIALSPHDDKRKISDNGIDTLPWGHYSLNI